MSVDDGHAPGRAVLYSIRLAYFARFAALAFLLPFINLFYRRHHLTGTEIGLMGTIGAVSALVAAPIWGRWSDATHHPRRLLQWAMAGSSLCVLLLGQQTVFGWMALFVALNMVMDSAVDPLSDNLAVALTRGQSYGSIRLWGSLGWAVLTLTAGWLIERAGLAVIFAGYVVFVVIAALALSRVPFPIDQPYSGDRTRLRQVLADLMHNRAMIGLLVALIFLNLSLVALQTFEPIYLDELGARETVIGLAYTIAALIEPVAMLWADRVIGTRGAGSLLRLGLLMTVARATLVLFFPVVPVIVGLHLLEGIGFALRQVAIVVFVSANAPSGQSATALALYSITVFSLTQAAGAPLVGLVYDVVGAYWLYALALAGLIASWTIVWFTLPRREALRTLENQG